MRCAQGFRSLLSIGGDNLQFYPNFARFSTLGEMNPNHDFFQVSKLSEDQKKVFTKIGTLFSPNSSGIPTLRCTLESNYWGDADVDLTQTIGGMKSHYWGGYIPPSPPGFGTPRCASLLQVTRNFPGQVNICYNLPDWQQVVEKRASS